MKTKILFSLLILIFNSVLLLGQNDSWLQKGYNAPNSKEKIKCFTKSIEEESATIEAYFSRAGAELEIKDYLGAVSDYTRIIEMDSNDAGAFYNRGFARHHYTKDYRGALADYSKAFGIDSTNAIYVSLMGLLNSLLEDWPNAIASYKKCLLICSDNKNALNFQGGVGMSKIEPSASGDHPRKRSPDKLKRIQPDFADVTIGLALALFYTHDRVNAKRYFLQARELIPLLSQGVKGLESYETESCTIYPKDEKALKKMLKKFK